MKVDELLKILCEVEGKEDIADVVILGEMMVISEKIHNDDIRKEVYDYLKDQVEKLSDREVKIEELIK